MMTRTEARLSQESQLQPVKTHRRSKAPTQDPSAANFRRREHERAHVQSDRSAPVSGAQVDARSPVSGVHCQTHASSTRGRAFADFTAQRCVVGSGTMSFFQAQEAQKQQ